MFFIPYAYECLLPSDSQVPTISVPDITSGKAIPSATTRGVNDDGQDLDPTILSELTHLLNWSLPSVVVANTVPVDFYRSMMISIWFGC
jgi:hypothetical protein